MEWFCMVLYEHGGLMIRGFIDVYKILIYLDRNSGMQPVMPIQTMDSPNGLQTIIILELDMQILGTRT